MQTISVFLFAAALSLAAVPSAHAFGTFHRSRHDHQTGHGSGDTQVHAVPSPTAGIGASAVLIAGGYLWLVRRRAKSRKDPK
ncbi:MAG: hypothetical protein ACTHJ3_11500 [Pararhizobium sp.]